MTFTVVQPQLQKMVANIQSGNGKPHLGFTYMGLLMVLAISSIAMAVVAIVWHKDIQREREKELRFIGESYKKAIGSYFESKVNGTKEFPEKLEDLLLDSRFPTIKRHIRKLYADPFNKNPEKPDKAWGLELQQGRIIGVYSLSEEKIIQQNDQNSNGPIKYKDLRFIYVPVATGAQTNGLQNPAQSNLSDNSNTNVQLPEFNAVNKKSSETGSDALNQGNVQLPETLNNVRSVNAPTENKP